MQWSSNPAGKVEKMLGKVEAPIVAPPGQARWPIGGKTGILVGSPVGVVVGGVVGGKVGLLVGSVVGILVGSPVGGWVG